MAVKFYNEPSLASSFGSKLGEGIGRGTLAFVESFQKSRQEQAEQQRLQGLRSKAAELTGISPELLNLFDGKQIGSVLTDYAKNAPKEQAKQQEREQGINRALKMMDEIKTLHGATNIADPYLKKVLQTTAQSKMRSNLKALAKNPYFRKAGIALPEDTLGQELPIMMDEAINQLKSFYEMESPQQEQPQPQELKIPKDQFGRPQPLPQMPNPQQMVNQLPQEPSAVGRTLRALPGEALAGAGGVPSNLLDLAQLATGGLRSLGKNVSQALGLPTTQEDPYAPSPAVEALQGILPTAESLSERLTPELPEDASQEERSIREATRDIGSFVATAALGGGPKAVTSAKNLLSALKIEGAGNLAKYLTTKLGYGKYGDMIKPIVSLGTAYKMGPSYKNVAQDIYKEGRQALPETLKITDDKLRREIINDITYFGKTESGFGKVTPAMENFLKNQTYGNAMDITSDLNMADLASESSRLRRSGITTAVKEAIKKDPKVPKAAKTAYETADSLWGTVSDLKSSADFLEGIPFMKRFIDSEGKEKLATTALSYLVSPHITAAGVAGLGVNQLNKFKIAMLALKRPGGQKAFTQVMKAGIGQNPAQAATALVKLGREVNAVRGK